MMGSTLYINFTKGEISTGVNLGVVSIHLGGGGGGGCGIVQ